MSDTRPVWLTREQIILLTVDLRVVHAIQDAWYQAPDDPAEAGASALRDYWQAENPHHATDEHDRAMALSVLRAIRMPEDAA